MAAGAHIVAVCASQRKGTRKQPVGEGELRAEYGLVGDAHAGSGRQVSLLAQESIERMRARAPELGPGDFAENLTIEGLELHTLAVGTVLRVGSGIRLQITQIGKRCHTECEIARLVGTCVMPKEGVFARVLEGGMVRAGDPVQVERGR